MKLLITARHFRWPCAIFAHTGVFKMRITILKFHEFHEIPRNFKKVPLNSCMECHGTREYRKVPWNSMELYIWTKFHEFHGTCGFVAYVPWNSIEPQVLFKCCSKSSMELWRKFHWTLLSQYVSMSIEEKFWMIFWYVMRNAGNAYGMMNILMIKHKLAKETYINIKGAY